MQDPGAVQVSPASKKFHFPDMSKLGELRELRLLANRQIRNRRLRLTLFFPNERPGNGLMRAQSLTVRSNVGFGLTVDETSSLNPDAANTVPSLYLPSSRYPCIYSLSALNDRIYRLFVFHVVMSGPITYSPSAIARLTSWYSTSFSMLAIRLSSPEIPTWM